MYKGVERGASRGSLGDKGLTHVEMQESYIQLFISVCHFYMSLLHGDSSDKNLRSLVTHLLMQLISVTPSVLIYSTSVSFPYFPFITNLTAYIHTALYYAFSSAMASSYPSNPEPTHACQQTIGYTFQDPTLLWEALQADGSIACLGATGRFESGNKRLAIVGDRVLDLMLSLKWYPTWQDRGMFESVIQQREFY